MSKKNEKATAAVMAAAVIDAAVAEVRRGPALASMLSAEKLAYLEELGSRTASQAGITYEGEQFRLPAAYEGNLDAAVQRITEIKKSEEGTIRFTRTLPYRLDDGAVAFARAMEMVFGTQGVGESIFTMFGEKKPELRMVPTGLNEEAEAPHGKIFFADMQATFYIDSDWTEEHGYVFQIACECPRKYHARVEGFFAVIQNLLRTSSIYKGKAITGSETPGFFNPFAVDSSRVVYTPGVLDQLEEVVMTPLRHTAALREAGIPVKRCCMLAGPYGTGKSLAGMLVAQVAVQAGWTFILVRAGEDPYQAINTAKLYAPAVIMVEDVDNLAAGQTRKKITEFMDLVDSVSVKGQEIILLTTTNFPDDIDMGMLRPGRTDVIIDIDHLGPAEFTKLIPAVLPVTALAAGINYAAIAEAFNGLYPAFATEACYRAFFRSLRRDGSKSMSITEEDLLAGAEKMQAHWKRMQDAVEAKRHVPDVDSTMADLVAATLRRTKWSGRALEVDPVER